MAAIDQPTPSLTALLQDFTDATKSAHAALTRDPTIYQLPANGISLLDTKNEIFLAYVQALALRNLEVLRQFKNGGDATSNQADSDAADADGDAARSLSEQNTRKLVELRVYLEKGVRPLESRLKFRLDRVVKTADEEDARAVKAVQEKQRRAEAEAQGEDEDEDEDDEDDDENEDEPDPTSFRPNAAMMVSSSRAAPSPEDSSRGHKSKPSASNGDGIYRPPRISATAMPTRDGESERNGGPKQRAQRSATLDEYVADELSTQPRVEPSIGSTITAGGRRTKTTRQLRDEAERRQYEETNLVRLPVLSKKDRAQRSGRGAQDGGFGGDEWRGIGDSVDRIAGLTKRGSKKDGVLDRSRKRAVEDGPRGDGHAAHGAQFEQKRRRLTKKGRV